MAAITAALIKQVREETGAGMMDVKKALTEAEGDVARAKEIIRAKGIQAAGKREGRKAQEGTIASTVVESANDQTGYAVELNSETDFVAKTPKFVEFAGSVLDDAVKAEASSVDEVLAAASGDTTVKEAVEEAHKLGIPVVAIVDTNADPESVEYPIAANDDAIRGIELLTSLMADAVAEGLLERSGKAAKAEGETEQPMAAWEKELLTEGAPAADAPAEAEAEAEGEAKAE